MIEFFNYIGSALSDFCGWIIDCILWLVNGLLSGIGGLVSLWFSSIGLSMEFPPSIYDTLREIMLGVGYILPLEQLLPIPIFMLAFYIAKFVFAIFNVIAKTVIERIHIVG